MKESGKRINRTAGNLLNLSADIDIIFISTGFTGKEIEQRSNKTFKLLSSLCF